MLVYSFLVHRQGGDRRFSKILGSEYLFIGLCIGLCNGFPSCPCPAPSLCQNQFYCQTVSAVFAESRGSGLEKPHFFFSLPKATLQPPNLVKQLVQLRHPGPTAIHAVLLFRQECCCLSSFLLPLLQPFPSLRPRRILTSRTPLVTIILQISYQELSP